MNMFKSSDHTDISSYISAMPEDRRLTVEQIDKLIKKHAPGLKPYFASNMLGYGSYSYKDCKGKENSWPIIALANQKSYISLYICASDGDQYIPEKYKDQLGKVSVGKSCIRFKKIEQLDIDTLKRVIAEAAKLSEAQ